MPSQSDRSRDVRTCEAAREAGGSCGDFAVGVNDFLTVGRQPDCRKVFQPWRFVDHDAGRGQQSFSERMSRRSLPLPVPPRSKPSLQDIPPRPKPSLCKIHRPTRSRLSQRLPLCLKPSCHQARPIQRSSYRTSSSAFSSCSRSASVRRLSEPMVKVSSARSPSVAMRAPKSSTVFSARMRAMS